MEANTKPHQWVITETPADGLCGWHAAAMALADDRAQDDYDYDDDDAGSSLKPPTAMVLRRLVAKWAKPGNLAKLVPGDPSRTREQYINEVLVLLKTANTIDQRVTGANYSEFIRRAMGPDVEKQGWLDQLSCSILSSILKRPIQIFSVAHSGAAVTLYQSGAWRGIPGTTTQMIPGRQPIRLLHVNAHHPDSAKQANHFTYLHKLPNHTTVLNAIEPFRSGSTRAFRKPADLWLCGSMPSGLWEAIAQNLRLVSKKGATVDSLVTAVRKWMVEGAGNPAVVVDGSTMTHDQFRDKHLRSANLSLEAFEHRLGCKAEPLDDWMLILSCHLKRRIQVVGVRPGARELSSVAKYEMRLKAEPRHQLKPLIILKLPAGYVPMRPWNCRFQTTKSTKLHASTSTVSVASFLARIK